MHKDLWHIFAYWLFLSHFSVYSYFDRNNAPITIGYSIKRCWYMCTARQIDFIATFRKLSIFTQVIMHKVHIINPMYLHWPLITISFAYPSTAVWLGILIKKVGIRLHKIHPVNTRKTSGIVMSLIECFA